MDNITQFQQIIDSIDDMICDIEVNINKTNEAIQDADENKKEIYEQKIKNLEKSLQQLKNTQKYYYNIYQIELLKRCL